jgi:hypothetical protein
MKDFGAETSITPRTVSPFSPGSRLSGRAGRILRASTARFVESCDPPHVSAHDAFDSVTASRQRTTSTHASVWSRFRQQTCACRSIEGFGFSRCRQPASVGLWSLLFTSSSVFFSNQCHEAEPLTPLSLHEIKPARIQMIRSSPLHKAEDRSQRNFVKNYAANDLRCLSSPGC